jgi:hypothetical protein
MGFPVRKNDDQQAAELTDPTVDREQRLSKNFEDPPLEDFLPDAGEGGEEAFPLSLVVGEGEPAEELPLAELPLAEPDPLSEEPPPAFDESAEAGHESARWIMSEKLFQLVVSERGFDDLVEAALQAVLIALQAEAGSVVEFDYDRRDFFFRANIGGASSPERLKAFRVPEGKGIVGHVAESRQAILLRDLEHDTLQMKAIGMGVGFEPRTCMAAPIIVGGQLYGVIEFFNRTDGSLFEEKDLRLVEDAVRMISKVMEVRFLMAELLRRAG